MNRIISRIFGDFGNQLACYAAACRLALVSNAKLLLDNLSGFVRVMPINGTTTLISFLLSASAKTLDHLANDQSDMVVIMVTKKG